MTVTKRIWNPSRGELERPAILAWVRDSWIQHESMRMAGSRDTIGLVFRSECADKLPSLLDDRVLLQKVTFHLLLNASDATGKVRIS